ncbi:unnamed protein product, partial [Oppiella nova]
MSFIEVSEIEFTSKKSCFISIPKTWTLKATEKVSIFAIKSLREEEDWKEVVMSWSGETTASESCIQMNGLFGNKMGFSHRQQVLVSHVPTPHSQRIANADKCYLKPITENDWEILSMNSAFIEANLLNQIRVLSLGQIFPVWITNQSNVCLFVEAFHVVPNHSKAIILNNLSEVIVCPPNTARNTIDDSNGDGLQSTDTQTVDTNEFEQNSNQSMISSVFGFVKSFITSSSAEESKPNTSLNSIESSKSSDKIQINTNLNFNEVFRVLPFGDTNDNEDKDVINTVFISNDLLNGCENTYFISKLTHILSPNEQKRENQKNEKSETNSASNEMKSVSKQISEIDFKETLVVVCGHNRCPKSAVVCNALRRQLGLSISSRVYLSPLNDSLYPVISSLVLCPINVSPKKSKVTNDLIRSDLIRLIDKTSIKMLCLTNGSLIHLCGTDFFTYHKNETSLYVITRMAAKELSVEICEPVMALQKHFCENPLPIACLKDIDKTWNSSLAECLHRQPSLLVFEDLDAIASMPSKPGQEASAEALHSERIALLFMDLIETINRNDISYGNRVAVIASSKSNKTLQTVLVQTRGKHLFQEFIELSSPDLKQRMEIISKLISNKFGVEYNESKINVNLKDIAIRCKGYQPLDMSALIERAFHNCFLISKTNCFKDLVLTEESFNAAFDGFSPSSLRGLDLELKSSRRLCEVGGLAEVKKCLMETILWSIKYPVLFSKLPLKAQSSILLFGAPGTGKTLLIEAIANECGINFIGIKGPELLSKYVGASEQSVRDLFSRAESAKPCILFFDEFDALAPRRGHDSTGVTDRVVNQLLTQMDGFEELGTGVYVLSATSRPDLIDPALLRPGRFDKCLYCPLPNQEERLDILNVLSSKLSLSSDIDLEWISCQTNHYTGADLQALLYSAQLEALHYGLNEHNKQFKQQIKSSSHSTHNQSLELIAYMPSLEKGFSRDLDT